MHLRVGCSFEFDLPVATHAVVLVEPHPSEPATVHRAHFAAEPETASSVYLDRFGNRCRRLTLPAGTAQLSFDASVAAASDPDPYRPDAPALRPDELPDDSLTFLLPSRYCESDELAGVAAAEFSGVPAGWAQVQAVCDWVHGHVRFDYGASSPMHTAASVHRAGTGVCRDFTHLGIALCRALNVPARYVFGYLPDIGVPETGPMDFAAWMEAYLGDRWYTFDPRNNERRIGRVVIGRGRDAADVAMVTTFGQVVLRNMTVWAAEDHAAVPASSTG